MKKTVRQKAKEFKNVFNNIKWKVTHGQGVLNVSFPGEDYFYSLLFEAKIDASYTKQEVLEIKNIYLRVIVSIKEIGYILDKFDFGGGTIRIVSEDLALADVSNIPYQGEHGEDYWDELFPIWTRQYYEEVMPSVERFKDLRELHAYDEEMRIERNEHKGGYFNRGIQHRLVTMRLIKHSSYKSYSTDTIERFEYLAENKVYPKYHDSLISELAATRRLISYLDDLDVDQYYRDKPWRVSKEQPPVVERSPIMTEQLSMLVIDRQIDTAGLSTLLGMPLTPGEQQTAGEAMMIDHSGDIHILDIGGKTILFLQDITAVSMIDWSQLSRGHRAMGLMIYEGATMTYILEYWDDGQRLLSRLDSEDARTQDEGSLRDQYADRETRELIVELFEKVAGRGLGSIYEDDKVIRYTLA